MTRLYLLALALIAGNFLPSEVSAQCTHLFFSEYIEGSSNNKVLEIYNPTSGDVDLGEYQLLRYNNGTTDTSGLFQWPAGMMLAAGDVYVIANPSADSVFLAVSDTTSSITFYNGDDALNLVYLPDEESVDIIGVIGTDPGSSWTVGTGSTQNHTLVRKSNVNEGQTNWSAGALEWEVFPSNFADSLGFHNIDNCELQNNAVAAFTVTSASGSEGDGGDTAFVSFSGITTNYTLNVEVLGSSTALQNVDWSSAVVPASYTITPGQTELNLPFSIIEDALPEDSEFFILKISEATGGLTIANPEYTFTILDNDNPPTPPCQFAFFSEYIEGSSNNKVLEIYNPTENTIDMGNYRLLRYNNGTTDTSGMMEFPQGTFVAPGEVYVIANPSADSVFQAQADTTSTITFYNGDDALNLVFIPNNLSVDVIGVIGEDPGTNWPVNGGATSENTLVRDPSVQGGQTNWTLAADTWIAYPSNFADSLGAHYMTPCGILPGCDTTNLVINGDITDESSLGEEDGAIDITVSGGLPPYSFSWSNGEETEDISGLAPADYTVTVTDFNGCTENRTFTVAPGPDPCEGVTITITGDVTDESVEGANDGAIDISVSGGTPAYAYSWSNGATTEDVSALAPDTYTVVVTDAVGCTGTETFTVADGPGPCDTVTIVVTGVVTDESSLGANDGAIDITVSGGTPGFTYAWSNSATTEDISGLAPATYTVVVTDSRNCSGTESFTVEAGPDPCAAVNIQLSVVVTDESVSGANDGAIDLTVAGGTPAYTYAWSNGATTEDISGLAPAVYTVTVTDSEGCTGTISGTVDAGPTGVNDIASLKLFKVYPNPASGAFAVSLQFERVQTIDISVTDVAGKVLYQTGEMRVQSAVMPIPAGWASGLYFLKVSAEGKLAVEPVMIY